jgi:hypothetical protein
MSWSVWQLLKNTAIIEDGTKKECYNEVIEDLKNILDLWCKPLDPSEMKEFRDNLDQTIEKYEDKVKKLEENK